MYTAVYTYSSKTSHKAVHSQCIQRFMFRQVYDVRGKTEQDVQDPWRLETQNKRTGKTIPIVQN